MFKYEFNKISNKDYKVYLLFSLFFTISYLLFYRWSPGVFYGDDLSNRILFETGQLGKGITSSLLDPVSEKYRPVFITIISSLFTLFGRNYNYYILVNILIHSISACICFFIIKSLVKNYKLSNNLILFLNYKYL